MMQTTEATLRSHSGQTLSEQVGWLTKPLVPLPFSHVVVLPPPSRLMAVTAPKFAKATDSSAIVIPVMRED